MDFFFTIFQKKFQHFKKNVFIKKIYFHLKMFWNICKNLLTTSEEGVCTSLSGKNPNYENKREFSKKNCTQNLKYLLLLVNQRLHSLACIWPLFWSNIRGGYYFIFWITQLERGPHFFPDLYFFNNSTETQQPVSRILIITNFIVL